MIYFVIIFLCQVVEAVMKECKKENIAYKVEAMKCIGNLLEGYKVDQFKDMWTLITPVLEVSLSLLTIISQIFSW